MKEIISLEAGNILFSEIQTRPSCINIFYFIIYYPSPKKKKEKTLHFIWLTFHFTLTYFLIERAMLNFLFSYKLLQMIIEL